ncbi:phosphatase PAP2 family protein [Natronobiforma cellulositropha]|uniref:phosphatase PAP2 family protein n=1 Tax=Natronobiforma cellulositropha TaxID=1679076 RepID=UPI0021D5B934|nr:phosphatase PAP2 family protein [Natronobiforma cellulositropha]
MRDVGEIETAQSLVPEWALPVVELLTVLGDVWFLLLVGALAYWFGGRERGAYTFALVLGGLALVAATKAIFAVPRPPADLHLIATQTTSFPSGHATGTAIVYGALALTFDRVGTRRQRLVLAGVIVVVVGLTRIVLGVHYAVDVIAGVALGVAYLVAVTRVARGDPRLAFGVGAAVAVVGTALGAFSSATPQASCLAAGICLDRDALAAVVGTASALAVWTVLEDARAPRARWYSVGILAFAGLVVIPAVLAVGAFDPMAGTRALGAGVAVAAIMFVPLAIRG